MGFQVKEGKRKMQSSRLIQMHLHQAERGISKRTNLRLYFKLFCLIAGGILGAVYLWAAVAFFFAVTP